MPAVSCAAVSRGFLSTTNEGVLIRLRVSPGARRPEIEGAYGGDALKLRVTAPPVDGKANAEAERLLAGELGVGRSGVSVVRGAKGRDKTVLVRGASEGDIRATLGKRLSG